MPARSEAELLGQVLNLMCFAEPTSSYLADGGQIEIPEGVIVHHEVELGVIIGKPGKDISAASAFDHVAGYCVALDLCVGGNGASSIADGGQDGTEHARSRQEGGPAVDGGQRP